MISTIAILNISCSGPGQFLTLVGYSSVLDKIDESRRFESESRFSQNDPTNPDKALSLNVFFV